MSSQLLVNKLRFLCVLLCVTGLSLKADPIITVEPSTPTASVGDNFTVDIDISDVTDLYAFQFDLGFNPNLVEVDNVTEGSFLSGGGSTFFIPGTIDNVGGSVSDNADTLLTAISGVTGSGIFATFDLTAIGPGDSSLTAFNIILLDSSLTEISATVENGSVDVAGVATPEPRYLALLMGGALLLLIFIRRRMPARNLLWMGNVNGDGIVVRQIPPG